MSSRHDTVSVELPAPLRARYRVREVLGTGSYGAVLLAQDRQLGREVALKLLRDAVDDEDAAARFRREARITAELRHPGVVGVYDHGVDEDTGEAWIIYEYVEGEDLREALQREGSIRARQVARWGAILADALQAAHSAGVVHRDLKPENVLLRHGTEPLLADFGVARAAGSGTVETMAGMILGTPAYMAPEIWYGGEQTPASDQFSLAATLFEALLGRSAWGTRVPAEILARLDGWEPGATSGRERDRAPQLVEALARALERDPARRFPDAARFSAALRHAELALAESVTGERLAPRTRVLSTGLPGTGRTVRLRRRYRWLGSLLGATLLAGAVGTWMSGGEAPVAPPRPSPSPSPRPRDPLDTAEFRALEREVERGIAKLARPDGQVDLSFREPRYTHLTRVLPVLLDVRQDAQWKRLFDATLAWLDVAAAGSAAAPGLDAPEVQRFLRERLVPFLHLYLQDVIELSRNTGYQLISGGADLIHPGALSLEELAKLSSVQLERLRPVVQEFGRAVEGRPYGRHCAVEAMALLADLTLEAGVLGDTAYGRMRSALARSESCAYPYLLALAALKPFGVGRGGIRELCDDRLGLLRSVERHVQTVAPQLSSARRTELATRLLVSCVWTFETCTRPGDSATEAWYRRLLARTRVLIAAEPASVLGEVNEALAAFGMANTILGVGTPDMRRRMEDLDQLRLEAQGHLR